MAYTPINWQTGDTITADKLNKMDRGWGVESTQLFSETVTTESGPFGTVGMFEYSTQITADTIIVTFGGTAYTCNAVVKGSNRIYGDNTFMAKPFVITSTEEEGNYLATPEAGTYAVEISTLSIEVSSQFVSVVNSAIPELIPPFRLVKDETTRSEFNEARSNNRFCYLYDGGIQYVATGLGAPISGQPSLNLLPAPNVGSYAFDSDGILRYIDS